MPLLSWFLVILQQQAVSEYHKLARCKFPRSIIDAAVINPPRAPSSIFRRDSRCRPGECPAHEKLLYNDSYQAHDSRMKVIFGSFRSLTQVSPSFPYNLGSKLDNSETFPPTFIPSWSGQPAVNDEIREDLVRPMTFRESGTMVAVSSVCQRKRSIIQ